MPQTADRKLKKRIRATVAALILVIAAVIWWRWLTTEPTFDIPTPRAPVPNAYDIYRAAGQGLVDIDGRPLTHDKLIDIAFDKVDAKRQTRLAEINQSALAKARLGFLSAYLNPTADKDSESYRNYRTQMIALGKLFVWKGDTNARVGNLTEAAQSYLDALQFGSQTEYSCVLGCESASRKGLWSISNRLTSFEARAAASRLETVNNSRRGFVYSLRQQETRFQMDYRDMLCRPGYPLSSADSFISLMRSYGVKELRPRGMPHLYATLLTESKRSIVAESGRYWDSWIIRSEGSYADAFKETIPEPSALLEYEALFISTQCMGPTPPPYPQGALRNEFGYRAETNLLIAALALRAYRGQHGAYPEALADLVPHNLRTVPRDPYATAAPLKYRRTGKSFVLYSIGPNGVDDGGKALAAGSDACCEKLTYDPTDGGDIVVAPAGLMPKVKP